MIGALWKRSRGFSGVAHCSGARFTCYTRWMDEAIAQVRGGGQCSIITFQLGVGMKI